MTELLQKIKSDAELVTQDQTGLFAPFDVKQAKTILGLVSVIEHALAQRDCWIGDYPTQKDMENARLEFILKGMLE